MSQGRGDVTQVMILNDLIALRPVRTFEMTIRLVKIAFGSLLVLLFTLRDFPFEIYP